MRGVLGAPGAVLIAAGIAFSTFGFLNLVILVSPRVYRTMAADGAFFPQLARLHPRYRTPAAAIVFQGAWAILLTLSGTYGQLLDYVVFGDWIFFGLVVSTLFVYRRREARRAAPGPGTAGAGLPGVGLPLDAGAVRVGGACTWWPARWRRIPRNAAVGAGLLALGVPVFLFWRARRARSSRIRPWTCRW